MKKTQITAIKRIIKSAEKLPRPALHGIFTDESGRACACDGFRAVRLTLESPEGFRSAAGVDLKRFFDAARGASLPLPSVDDLKAIIKEAKEKKEKKAIFDFGAGLPMVDARFLLDMLRIFPDAKAYTTARNAKTGAIFFDSFTGDGLLMPIFKGGGRA